MKSGDLLHYRSYEHFGNLNNAHIVSIYDNYITIYIGSGLVKLYRHKYFPALFRSNSYKIIGKWCPSMPIYEYPVIDHLHSMLTQHDIINLVKSGFVNMQYMYAKYGVPEDVIPYISIDNLLYNTYYLSGWGSGIDKIIKANAINAMIWIVERGLVNRIDIDQLMYIKSMDMLETIFNLDINLPNVDDIWDKCIPFSPICDWLIGHGAIPKSANQYKINPDLIPNVVDKLDVNNMISAEQLQYFDITKLNGWNIDGIWKYDCHHKNNQFIYEYIKYVVGKVLPTVENLKKLLHCYCHNHYQHLPYYLPNHINNNPITQGEFIYKILIDNIDRSKLIETNDYSLLCYLVYCDCDLAKIQMFISYGKIEDKFIYPQWAIDKAFDNYYDYETLLKHGYKPSNVDWNGLKNDKKLIYIKYVKPSQDLFDEWVNKLNNGFQDENLIILIRAAKMHLSNPITNLSKKRSIHDLYEIIKPL